MRFVGILGMVESQGSEIMGNCRDLDVLVKLKAMRCGGGLVPSSLLVHERVEMEGTRFTRRQAWETEHFSFYFLFEIKLNRHLSRARRKDEKLENGYESIK